MSSLRGRWNIGSWPVQCRGVSDLLHTCGVEFVAKGRDLRAAFGTIIGNEANLDQLVVEQCAVDFRSNGTGQSIGTGLHDRFEVVGLLFKLAPCGVIQIQ